MDKRERGVSGRVVGQVKRRIGNESLVAYSSSGLDGEDKDGTFRCEYEHAT